MTQAPSIKEALELARSTLIALRTRLKTEPSVQGRGWVSLGIVTNDAIEKADRALATLQPSGERRESIARIIEEAMRDTWNDICDDTNCHPIDIEQLGNRALAFNPDHWSRYTGESAADKILASSLVQDEAGWRDSGTIPMDGTNVLIAEDHRGSSGEAYYDAEEGRWYWANTGRGDYPTPHEPCPTHWQPLPTPPIRSARTGGAET